MSTVTITGNFNDSSVNTLSLEVFQVGIGGYDFQKKYQGSFSETFSDLDAASEYLVEFTGSTTGTFDLTIDGDIPAGISKTYKGALFMDDITLKTN